MLSQVHEKMKSGMTEGHSMMDADGVCSYKVREIYTGNVPESFETHSRDSIKTTRIMSRGCVLYI